jgi:hypothetical protein
MLTLSSILVKWHEHRSYFVFTCFISKLNSLIFRCRPFNIIPSISLRVLVICLDLTSAKPNQFFLAYDICETPLSEKLLFIRPKHQLSMFSCYGEVIVHILFHFRSPHIDLCSWQLESLRSYNQKAKSWCQRGTLSHYSTVSELAAAGICKTHGCFCRLPLPTVILSKLQKTERPQSGYSRGELKMRDKTVLTCWLSHTTEAMTDPCIYRYKHFYIYLRNSERQIPKWPTRLED